MFCEFLFLYLPSQSAFFSSFYRAVCEDIHQGEEKKRGMRERAEEMGRDTRGIGGGGHGSVPEHAEVGGRQGLCSVFHRSHHVECDEKGRQRRRSRDDDPPTDDLLICPTIR
jgi:hypothetical protein